MNTDNDDDEQKKTEVNQINTEKSVCFKTNEHHHRLLFSHAPKSGMRSTYITYMYYCLPGSVCLKTHHVMDAKKKLCIPYYV